MHQLQLFHTPYALASHRLLLLARAKLILSSLLVLLLNTCDVQQPYVYIIYVCIIRTYIPLYNELHPSSLKQPPISFRDFSHEPTPVYKVYVYTFSQCYLYMRCVWPIQRAISSHHHVWVDVQNTPRYKNSHQYRFRFAASVTYGITYTISLKKICAYMLKQPNSHLTDQVPRSWW